MAITHDQVVSAVKDQHGFDTTDAVLSDLVNEVHKRVVSDAHWLMETVSLGNTVAGTATYDVAANVVDLVAIYLNDPNTGKPGRYGRISTTELWDVKAGLLVISGSGGVVAPQFKADGTQQIEIYPAPDVSGVPIMGLLAAIPADVSGSNPLLIPDDMKGGVIDAVIALGEARIDGRLDTSQVFEGKAVELVGKLAGRKNSRIGSGPTRALVWGYDF